MEKKNISFYTLEGSHGDIGRQMARKTGYKSGLLNAPETFSENDLKAALDLYEQYCPGLVEELKAYAEACEVSIREIAFTWMTYLIPRCSGLMIEGSMMDDGHTRLVRNYEFDLEHEDLIVFQTKVQGKYAHIGGSLALFGRTEGVNECGLGVSMSSCGLPVSNMIGMRPAKIRGLQFWAVIRSLLENCKDVEEALNLLKEMPIAYNINLLLADEKGNGCIFETMDGAVSYQEISMNSSRKHLSATNHIVIPSFQKHEPYAMKNSVVRLEKIEEFMKAKQEIKESDLRDLFVKKYPQGLSTSYYDDFFGTVKTVVMDMKNRSFKIRWFAEADNGWEIYQVTGDHEDHVLEKIYVKEKADPSFFQRVHL